jgi:ABC-2 type transport system ATP-binding protein
MITWKNRKEYVKNIGVVFGQRSQLWWDIPAEDTFDLLRDIYDIPEEEFQATKEDLIKRLNLSDIINIPVRQLSLGQRMRCEIAASLLHNPEILFLDEPTIGLDAVSKQVVRDFIKKLNKEKNTTIILTSHDMSDIKALAKRIVLIGKGKVLYDGSLKRLQNQYETQEYVSIKTKDNLNIRNKGIIKKNKNKEGYDLVIDTRILSISQLLNLISKKITIEDIEIDHEELDNIIVKLYQDYKI